MSGFEFNCVPGIVFGPGTVKKVPRLAAGTGKYAFVVTGRSETRPAFLIDLLNREGIRTEVFRVSGEPEVSTVTNAVEKAIEAGCDFVIGTGGGSVIDTGKAVAALMKNRDPVKNYLEIVGLGKPLMNEPAPFIAIPTTAGTGSEATHNSVLSVPEHKAKVSLRSLSMRPNIAVIDPELTYAMPPAVTASTGLDALTQVMEPFVSVKANPVTDALCREGMKLAARSLERAFKNGNDAKAREDMAAASLLGGLALSNAGLGAVHGFAGAAGGMFNAPHGVLCARFLPHVMEVNILALLSRVPDSPAMERYDEIGRILTGENSAKATDGIRWVKNLCKILDVPGLAEFGIGQNDFPDIAAGAKRASSMKGNPVWLENEELSAIMEKAL